jgi:hypothetical protein
LAALLALSACASGVPVEREVTVSGAQFVNVQGEADLVVRTFVPSPEGRRELLGAQCDLTTSLYAARLTTPSRLRLPNFGPQSPELQFVCRADGLTGAARREILTRWDRPPGGYGYPPAGWYAPYDGGAALALGWGYGGWWGPSLPVSYYPDVRIELR